MGAETLETQFRILVKKLESMTRNMNDQELAKTNSKELISRFFHEENGLSTGIEMILQAIAVSSIKCSVESVLKAQSAATTYEIIFKGQQEK